MATAQPMNAMVLTRPGRPLETRRLPIPALDAGRVLVGDIPSFPYRLLWGERQIVSIANLTRKDAMEFLALAAKTPIRTHVKTFPIIEANAALEALRSGTLEGAAVLDIGTEELLR